MPSVAMMAARSVRIPSYPSPRLYSPGTSFASRLHVNRFPASRLPFSRFQSSAPGTEGRGTHSGLSTSWSRGLFRSSQRIRRFFVKFQESQRWFSGKIKALLPQTNMGLGLATIFVGSAGNVVYAQYSNLVREKRLHSALAMGAVPDVKSTEELVERPDVTRAIEYILKPKRNYGSYDMIVGNHGTGKTTMVRHVAHQLEGVLYVDISPNSVSDKTFAEAFAKAFNWTPATSLVDMLLSYWGMGARETADDRALLVKVFKEFRHQAEVFEKNKGRPPVLVLDNVNRLAQRNPELLNILQDIAKDAADDRLFITVFVTSEGQAPIQMLGRSASSRLGEVVEIGDLNDDEAMDFLCNKRAIAESGARDIYGLVGGRVGLLARTANKLNSGLDFPVLAGVRASLLADVNKVLQEAGMEEEGESRRAGLQIASHILQHGRISRRDFYRISGSKQQGNELLSKNVFTTAPRSAWVVFDTKMMEIALRELVDNSGDPTTTVKLPETRK
ncbi:hypothetical protein C7212DRAFT_362855 [Tuber magnatum]|uniref:Orc1-like AAA ATPase domain-containing protein n=1 Tax=Tuber magnatum TaxID=42249 RepID=A0A317SS04_9PEZI|nr:hypothetical protein C7212DRAFT_362855 [Tuber magnatum]